MVLGFMPFFLSRVFWPLLYDNIIWPLLKKKKKHTEYLFLIVFKAWRRFHTWDAWFFGIECGWKQRAVADPLFPRNSGRPIAGSRFLGTGPLYNRAFWFVYRSATKRTHSWTQTQVMAPRKRIFYLQKTIEEWSKNSLTEYDNQKIALISRTGCDGPRYTSMSFRFVALAPKGVYVICQLDLICKKHKAEKVDCTTILLYGNTLRMIKKKKPKWRTITFLSNPNTIRGYWLYPLIHYIAICGLRHYFWSTDGDSCRKN